MRIRNCLLLSTSGVVGGMEQAVLGLVRELPAHGWDVSSVFPGSTSQHTLDWATKQYVTPATEPAVLTLAETRTFKAISRLQRLVETANTDLVNIHFGANYISWKDILAIRLAGTPTCIASVHHPWRWTEIDDGERKRRSTQLASQLVHGIVATSEAMRDILLEAGVAAEKVVIIAPGAKPPCRVPHKARVRDRLGIEPDTFVIGCVARLVPSKGIHDLIDAMQHVEVAEQDVVLLIAGDGPERGQLERRAGALSRNRVQFLGHVPNVHDVYAAADVFALPSHSEGYGIVFTEAAFHGVPSVAARVGGVPTAIVHGETGLLVPPHAPLAVARAIKVLYDDPGLRYRLGDAARTRAYTQLTEARMAERYAQYFDEVASARRGTASVT